MNRRLKVIIAILLIIAFIPVIGTSADDKIYYKGEAGLQYDFGDNVELEIDGIRFAKTQADYSITVSYTANGVDNNNNAFFLNDTEIGKISNNSSTIDLPVDLLIEGENELKIVLTTISGPLFDPSMVYGEYNLDDLDIVSVSMNTSSNINIPFTAIIKYMPKTGKSGVTINRAAFSDKKIAVGDGWNATTGLGGITPDIPVMVGLAFDIDFSVLGDVYLVDTTMVKDGEKTVKFYDTITKQYLDDTDTIYIDNNAPTFELSVSDGGVVTAGDPITVAVSDSVSGVSRATVAINDGMIRTIPASGAIELTAPTKLGSDNRLTLFAEDENGNIIRKTVFFTVVNAQKPMLTVNQGVAELEGATDFFGLTLLSNINMYTNRAGSSLLTHLRSSDEQLVQFSDELGKPTTAIGTAVPYQAFVVDTSGVCGEIALTYSGKTNSGFDIQLCAWNHTQNQWDLLEIISNDTPTTVIIDTAIYSMGGQMRLNVMPYLPTNNSDTMLWHTDTQYYSRFEDLYFQYQAIMDYAVEQYQNNLISYVIHTGDLIDESENDTVAIPQYEFSSRMQRILDDAGVPNGVLAGNHDVRHTSVYYNYFARYFPASRYSANQWYGGSLQNNTHHYDLVTVGGYDFVVLYLGYGLEATDETVAWANGVLKRYADRNAIIATHEYILPSGEWSGDNAPLIWKNIVVPNDNVKMILCGHNPGICNQWRQVEGSQRRVLEVLHDYQFSELGMDPQHVINNITCDGEGFLRLMTFTEAGQLIMRTYSPSHELENYFAPYSEYFIHDLDLITTERFITTDTFVVGGDAKTLVGGDTSGYQAVYATTEDGYNTPIVVPSDYKPTEYTLGATVEYSFDPIYINKLWYKKVSPYLTHSSPTSLPETSVSKLGVNLLQYITGTPYKVNGSRDYTMSITDEGYRDLIFNDNSGWTSVQYSVNNSNSIKEYPYLYFGITTDDHSMWNIVITTSTGAVYDFSRSLYEQFGYEDYSIPSDITGAWHGRILLDGLKDGEYVRYVTLVSAIKGRKIQFNYLFMGAPIGVETAFVADGVTIIVDSEADIPVEIPEPPFVVGHIFDGWYDSEGNRVQGEYAPTTNTTLTARYVEKSTQSAKLYNTELPMAELAEQSTPPDPSPDNTRLIYLVAACVILGIIGIVVPICLKKKQK